MADKTQAILKGVTSAIKQWGAIMGERNKLQADLLANEMKKRSNWLWKMRERMTTPEGRGQQWLQQQPMGQISPFQGYVGRAPTGQRKYYPPTPEAARLGWARGRRQAGLNIRSMSDEPWSEELDAPLLEGLERKFYGVKEKEPTFQQQINKSNAIEMLRRGEFTDRQEAEDYLIEELKIDITDPEIQQTLEQYKVAGEEGKKGWFQKYPKKTKFGYTYEKREDGKWHRID